MYNKQSFVFFFQLVPCHELGGREKLVHTLGNIGVTYLIPRVHLFGPKRMQRVDKGYPSPLP